MANKQKEYQGYKPPFTLSARAVGLVADIAAQMERFAIRMEQDDALRLRKVNRIKTIHSSLAIEGNHLLESEVADIIDGKTVVAPVREIQEVKNAIRVYDEFEKLDPFSMDDLLRAHGLMMSALTDDAGHFRKGGVGVYSENGLVHMAPPAERVYGLMSDLFGWLKNADDHLLVRSCVFHYEFEFIHPFIDGNGRMGRLWQSLILSRWHPAFAHLPVENMVYSNQQAYYDAIAQSTKQGECGPFIDFMLEEIHKSVLQHKGEPLDAPVNDTVSDTANGTVKTTPTQEGIIDLVRKNPLSTYDELAAQLGVGRATIARNIAILKDRGVLERIGEDKNGYWKLKK
ncbi:MAG: Fic family protein [Bacteroidales bacterium]|nr:Fic family protein [Bacteroidales bacterium]MBQ9435164.1 Fic family protein [Bacteroidales bacterium]